MTKDDDFEKTRISFGVILRIDFENLPELKRKIKSVEDVDIVYQKKSIGKLHIEEGAE